MRHGAATGLREIIKVHGQGAGKTLDASQSLEEVCKTILQWDLIIFIMASTFLKAMVFIKLSC